MSRASLGDEMYRRVYFEVQEVLNVALGTEEDDGAGAGLVAEVMLLAQRYAVLASIVNPAVLDEIEAPEMVEKLLADFEKRMAESSGSSAVDAAPLYEVALGALRRHHPRPAQQSAVEQAARAIVAELEKQRVERGDDHIRLVGLGRTVEVRIVHNAVWLERQALAEGVTNKAVDDAIAVTAHAMLREPGSSSGGTT